MKNATRHADKLKTVCKSLLKEYPVPPFEAQEPLRALVRGAMSYDVPAARAEEAMTLVEREFVDLNELRVATELEVQELLGTKYPAIEQRVQMITRILNEIFEREHTLSLDRLKTVSKRETRDFLRALPEIHPFVEAYVMVFGFEGSAVPMDDQMTAYLIAEGVLEPETPTPDSQKFVEHHLKAEECYPFFWALRQAVSEDVKTPRKKAKA